MQLIKRNILYIFLILNLSCNTGKDYFKTKNNDYQILNLFFSKFQDTVFFDNEKTFYKVYKDSLMLKEDYIVNIDLINKKFKLDKTNVISVPLDSANFLHKKIIEKLLLNKKLVVVNLKKFDEKNIYKNGIPQKSKVNYKFKIDTLTYRDANSKAVLKIEEIYFHSRYGDLWGNGDYYIMHFEKIKNKWKMIGNFNKEVY